MHRDAAPFVALAVVALAVGVCAVPAPPPADLDRLRRWRDTIDLERELAAREVTPPPVATDPPRAASTPTPVATAVTLGPAVEWHACEASHYGDEFDGRRTASGTTFHNADMTAAHPDLPFGTVVHVERADDPTRAVTVTITDRGPADWVIADHPYRCLDLSQAAMRELTGGGTVFVEWYVVP